MHVVAFAFTSRSTFPVASNRECGMNCFHPPPFQLSRRIEELIFGTVFAAESNTCQFCVRLDAFSIDDGT